MQCKPTAFINKTVGGSGCSRRSSRRNSLLPIGTWGDNNTNGLPCNRCLGTWAGSSNNRVISTNNIGVILLEMVMDVAGTSSPHGSLKSLYRL